MKPFFCFFLSLFCFVSSSQAQTPTKNDFGVILLDDTKLYNADQQPIGTLKAGELFNVALTSKHPEWCVINTNAGDGFVKRTEIALFTEQEHLGDLVISGKKYQIFNASAPFGESEYAPEERTVSYPVLIDGGNQAKFIKTLHCCSQSFWGLPMDVLHATKTERSVAWFKAPEPSSHSAPFIVMEVGWSERYPLGDEEEEEEESMDSFQYDLVQTENGDIYAQKISPSPKSKKPTDVLALSSTPVYESPNEKSKLIGWLESWEVAPIDYTGIDCATKIRLKNGKNGYILSEKDCGAASVLFFNQNEYLSIPVDSQTHQLMTAKRELEAGGIKTVIFSMLEDNWATAYPISLEAPSNFPELFSNKHMEFTNSSDASEGFHCTLDSEENALVLHFIANVEGKQGVESFNYFKLFSDNKQLKATEIIPKRKLIKYSLD